MATVRVCPDCGTAYQLGDKFCRECGLRLSDTPLTGHPTQQMGEAARLPAAFALASAPERARNGGWLLVLAALVVFVVGGIELVAYLGLTGQQAVADAPPPTLGRAGELQAPADPATPPAPG